MVLVRILLIGSDFGEQRERREGERRKREREKRERRERERERGRVIEGPVVFVLALLSAPLARASPKYASDVDKGLKPYLEYE